MKKKLIFVLIILFLQVAASFAATCKIYKKSIEDKYNFVNQYQFWTKHILNLDKIILSEKQIEKLNSQIKMFKSSTNIIEAEYAPDFVKDKILKMFKYCFNKNRYFEDGNLVNKNFIEKLTDELNIENIKYTVKKSYFGIIRNRSFIKAVPTDRRIIRNIDTINFDRNIETVSHIFDLVKVLNVSKDSRWFYVVSQYYFGWVKRENVVIRETLYKFQDFVVILKNIPKYNLKLGDILPLENNRIYIFDRTLEVSALNPDEFSIGFLPFTKRNILKLVFNLLHAPYRWGGDIIGTDCSLFVMDIYRCFGVVMPRNSYKQAEVLMGLSLENVKDIEKFILKTASPLTSLIYKNGHIMLYIGSYENKVYIAHAFTMENFHKGEVLITDLDFGRKDFITSLKKLVFLDK